MRPPAGQRPPARSTPIVAKCSFQRKNNSPVVWFGKWRFPSRDGLQFLAADGKIPPDKNSHSICHARVLATLGRVDPAGKGLLAG